MVDFIWKEKYDFHDLVKIVHLLRSPGGCPWDQVQTHQSIRRNFLEETYEACEAIDTDDAALLCEELGDVLLQVLFHTDIEQDCGRFTLDDVTDGICKKLIYRHPHVFGSTEVCGTEEVLTNWDALKQAEKGQQTQTEVLSAVSRDNFIQRFAAVEADAQASHTPLEELSASKVGKLWTKYNA